MKACPKKVSFLSYSYDNVLAKLRMLVISPSVNVNVSTTLAFGHYSGSGMASIALNGHFLLNSMLKMAIIYILKWS